MKKTGTVWLRWVGVFALYLLIVAVMVPSTLLYWAAMAGIWIGEKLGDAAERLKP